ncbi:Putative monocarboxylate transporter mch1 [Trichoderma asperellum]|uniref:Putative monocarboxylate transporter mch1 n=1 Tax=Trichoderma asperellum TaxID=101201 RepID=UPI0033206121|nr:Putative monocarboxylate transporter mch1 [Trichoderma asperellum]
MPTSASPSDQQRFIYPTPPTALDEDDRSSFLASDDEGDLSSSVSDPLTRRRQLRSKQIVRFISLVSATIAALCAGSIVVFSLYAPKFLSRLHYTQFQVNGVAIGSSVALYLPISVMGYVCDRMGVAPLALLSAFLFGGGYGLAAGIYKKLDYEYNTLGKSHGAENGWSYPLMVLAFIMIGAGTCAMYISSVSTCAKNFGKGKYRGLALAMPITGFGLSGMWLSQFGSRFLAEKNPDGSRGDVDVFRFFVFLAVLLFVIGIVGVFTLKVVDEQDLIEEAIEELEQSGLLDGSSLLARSESRRSNAGYGAIPATAQDDVNAEDVDDDAQWKKNWVLNAETRRFLSDHTMWPFALAFLLMIGPGEAFINNLGTVIGTLTPPITEDVNHKTSAATHVSIFGVTSTIARLTIGTLTDILAPAPETQHIQVPPSRPLSPIKRFAISRVVFMLFFAVLLAAGLLFLASGAAQNHADRFWIVSGLVGAGYGAVFSLTPLIVTIIWGVENFATNFGIIAMLPAFGSTFWGLVYSAVYEAGARSSSADPSQPGDDKGGSDDSVCYGKHCYAATFWAEGLCVIVACFLLLWAWKGRGGWSQRGIVI